MDQPRRIFRNALILGVVALTAAGCGTRYPLGMSEAEWNRLTPEQQLQARNKDAEIRQARAAQRAQQREAKRRREAMLAAAERNRIQALYRRGHYGDILECVVDEGKADFHPGWHRFSPVPFALARGEGRYVKLRGGRRTNKFWAEYSEDGLELTICYREPRTRRRSRDCATVAGLTGDFANGIVKHVSASNIFQGARVLCTFRPGRQARPEMRNVIIHQENITIRNIIYGSHHRGRSYPRPYDRYAPPPDSRRSRDHRGRTRPRHRQDPAPNAHGKRTSEQVREANRRRKAAQEEELRRRRRETEERSRRYRR